MNRTIFLISLGLVALGTALPHIPKWWRRLRGRPKAMKTFARRLATEPGYGEYLDSLLADRSAAIGAAESAPPPADSEIPGLVYDLLTEYDETVNVVARTRLRKSLNRAEKTLLELLDHPECTWGGEGVRGSPATTVAYLLESIPSRALGPRIADLADDRRWWVYSHAVRARASIASLDRLKDIIEDLGSSDSIRAQAAQNGVDTALQHGWAEPGFAAEILEWASRRVHDVSLPHSAWAVTFYAQYGGEDAVRALQSPELLCLENNRTICFVLKELNKRSRELDPALLRRMIEKSLASEGKWPWEHVFPVALEALARVDPHDARAMADSQLDSSAELFADAAMEFIRRAEGLPDWWNADPPQGMLLDDSEREILRPLDGLREVSGEIGNGGVSQYFFNGSGDRWPEGVRALRAIGLDSGAIALEKAAHIVNLDGASLHRETRIKEYAALPPGKEKELDRLSSAVRDGIDLAALRFMLKHADLFRRIKAARLAEGLDKPDGRD